MFARMRFVFAFVTATAVILNSGCQAPGGPQPNGSSPNQSPSAAKTPAESDAPLEMMPAKIEARTFLAAARLHETQNRPLQALQQYQYALAEDPQNVAILVRIGVLHDQLGNGAEAEKAYRQALQQAPNDAQVHNNLAFSYILRQKWQDAEIALTRTLELAPEFGRARINLGLVLSQTNRFEDGLRQFQMVLPPEDAYYNMGLMYQSKRKLVEAAEAYKRAIELNPKLVAAHEQLKRIPAAVLSAADRKIEEAREADRRLAANSQEADLLEAKSDPVEVAGEIPATQPADATDERAAAPAISDHWFDDYLKGMMADLRPWVVAAAETLASRTAAENASVDDTAEIEAMIADAAAHTVPAEVASMNVPATQPAFERHVAADESLFSLNASMVCELDALFPAWQRSPEMVWDLDVSQDSTTLAQPGNNSGGWLDIQASPASGLVQAPAATGTWRPVAESVRPD